MNHRIYTPFDKRKNFPDLENIWEEEIFLYFSIYSMMILVSLLMVSKQLDKPSLPNLSFALQLAKGNYF